MISFDSQRSSFLRDADSPTLASEKSRQPSSVVQRDVRHRDVAECREGKLLTNAKVPRLTAILDGCARNFRSAQVLTSRHVEIPYDDREARRELI